MAERGFGRRVSTPIGIADPSSEPQPYSPSPPMSETGRLAYAAGRFRLWGETIGFVGILIAFLAAAAWPNDPASLNALHGQILIPDKLFDAIRPSLTGLPELRATVQTSAGATVVPVLFVLGLLSVYRRRWILTGLCAAFFLFPWPALGVGQPLGAMPALLFGVLGALRYYQTRAALAVVVLGSLLLGPMLLSTFTGALAALGPSPTRYKAVTLGELGLLTSPIDVAAISSLDGDAAAYVQAQQAALQSDLGLAAASLDQIKDPSGFPEIHRQRINALYDHIAETGQDGPDRQSAVRGSYAYRLTATWALMAIGSVLGLIGPFVDVLGGQMYKRSARVGAAQARLDKLREVQPIAPAAPAFGRKPSRRPLASLAASDGTHAMDAIARRLRGYTQIATIASAITVLSVLLYLLFRLPEAGSNTAFADVALTLEAARWARSTGLTVPDPSSGLDILTALMMPGGIIILLALIFVFKVRSHWLTVAGATLLSYFVLSSVAFVHHPPRTVQATSISGAARAELARSLANSAGALPAGDAAYILAQIVYIEGKSGQIAPLLQSTQVDPDLAAHQQRIDLMQEWAIAHGAAMNAFDPPILLLPMSFVRGVAVVMPFFIATGLLVALIASGLLALAYDRRRRIAKLLSELRPA